MAYVEVQNGEIDYFLSKKELESQIGAFACSLRTKGRASTRFPPYLRYVELQVAFKLNFNRYKTDS